MFDKCKYYKSLIGRLIYLTHTRPDITFSVGVVSRFMHSPSKHHLRAVKKILRYIAGTTGILYSHNFNYKLFSFTDSD